MKFLYCAAVVLTPETGEPGLILRPEIPVRIIGPKGVGRISALVDTGADNTILPKRLADDLGISLTTGTGPTLTAFGGQKLSVLFGDAVMEVEDEAKKYVGRREFNSSIFPRRKKRLQS